MLCSVDSVGWLMCGALVDVVGGWVGCKGEGAPALHDVST